MDSIKDQLVAYQSELVKQQGYATAMYGKWHLGHLAPFLPTRQGFDEWFGLPYSNDMWPYHPDPRYKFPDLPLMEGEKVVKKDARDAKGHAMRSGIQRHDAS